MRIADAPRQALAERLLQEHAWSPAEINSSISDLEALFEAAHDSNLAGIVETGSRSETVLEGFVLDTRAYEAYWRQLGRPFKHYRPKDPRADINLQSNGLHLPPPLLEYSLPANARSDIIRRLWNRHRVAPAYAWPFVRELERLLLLKAAARDTQATVYSPSGWVDKAWHELILDTRAYAAHCCRLATHVTRSVTSPARAVHGALAHGLVVPIEGGGGRATATCDHAAADSAEGGSSCFLHHNPDGSHDAGRHERYAATLAAYEARFGERAPAFAWEAVEEARAFAAIVAAQRDARQRLVARC